MRRIPTIGLAALLAITPALAGDAPSPLSERAGPEIARTLIAVADDFIVDVYHNGVKVPDDRREMVEEVHGPTVERIKLDVRKGDWLVFNVVNNRLRWGGASYFAVSGCFARDEFGFVSRPGTGPWSACDRPGDVDRLYPHRLPKKRPPGRTQLMRFLGLAHPRFG